jgi:hypothetical protein
MYGRPGGPVPILVEKGMAYSPESHGKKPDEPWRAVRKRRNTPCGKVPPKEGKTKRVSGERAWKQRSGSGCER